MGMDISKQGSSVTWEPPQPRATRTLHAATSTADSLTLVSSPLVSPPLPPPPSPLLSFFSLFLYPSSEHQRLSAIRTLRAVTSPASLLTLDKTPPPSPPSLLTFLLLLLLFSSSHHCTSSHLFLLFFFFVVCFDRSTMFTNE